MNENAHLLLVKQYELNKYHNIYLNENNHLFLLKQINNSVMNLVSQKIAN